MAYTEVCFRGEYVLNERRRQQKERLVAASFTAWQLFPLHTKEVPKWEAYLRRLGLSERIKISEDDLKREAAQAMANANKILQKAKAK